MALSFCSEDEKEMLSEIQQFLNQEIEVIKLGKKDYTRTLDVTQKSIHTDVRALIEDHEAWLATKKRKPSRKK
jgi:ATP-dependent RNA helicase RhlE